MARVLFNRSVGDDYWHLQVAGTDGHLQAKPGQFFHLRCPDIGLPHGQGRTYLRRPMSVYGADQSSGTVEFLYKVTGTGTAGLATLTPSDELDMFGPLGIGFTVPTAARHALIVARGVGLATMGPLVARLVEGGVSVTAICSFRNQEAEVGLEPFRQDGVTVSVVYDNAGSGSRRSSELDNVQQLLKAAHQERSIDCVYTCGSRRIATMLNQIPCLQGVASQIAVEQRMACGLGMCHACVVDVKTSHNVESRRVCCEGPVFALSEVVS